MLFKCAICGKNIELEAEPDLGQHVRCPFCNGKFSYGDKKSEITAEDLAEALAVCRRNRDDNRYYSMAPAGARLFIGLIFYGKVFKDILDLPLYMAALAEIEPELRVNDLDYLIEHEDNQELIDYFRNLRSFCGPEMSESPAGGEIVDTATAKAPKLGIIRPRPGDKPLVDLNAQAMMRKLEESQQRQEMSLLRQIEARRQEFIDQVKRHMLLIAVVIVASVIGLVMFSSWIAEREELRERERNAANERIRLAEEEKLEAAKRTAERQAAQEREREEAKRIREEKLKRRELERQEYNAEQEHIRQAAEQKRKDEASAREARNARAGKYAETIKSLRQQRLRLWTNRDKMNRPGLVNAEFHCVVPNDDGRFDFFEVNSESNGNYQVGIISSTGEWRDCDRVEYERRIRQHGAVIHDGESGYCFLPKADQAAWRITSKGINPAKLRLGELHNIISANRFDASSLAFDVSFCLNGRKEAVFVKSAAFGDNLPYDAFRKVILPYAESLVKEPKAKVVKQTVVFYDGNVIKRNIGGKTMVPRNPTHRDAKWLELSQEAQRQEESANAGPSYEEMAKYREQLRGKIEQLLFESTLVITVRERMAAE